MQARVVQWRLALIVKGVQVGPYWKALNGFRGGGIFALKGQQTLAQGRPVCGPTLGKATEENSLLPNSYWGEGGAQRRMTGTLLSHPCSSVFIRG